MCTKQETYGFPTGFTNLLRKITLNKRIWRIWKKTLNLALPTGGSKKKLKYEETTVLLAWTKTIEHTDTRTHTYKY